jgi:NAD(P)-dependent dehydrogenase (short-subunit alcohol dehydrogenase family)
MLVTGATDGIGRATVEALAARRLPVIVHGRSADKVDRVVAQLRSTYPTAPPAEGVVADLADLHAVRRMGEEVLARFPDLRVVVHNAGVYSTERRTSAQGHELTLAVNHLAPFALTRALAPALRTRPDARVVVVASMVHLNATVDFDDLMMEDDYDGYAAYAQSKLCNVLFANALARREPAIATNSLHPGVIATKLLREGFGGGGGSVASGAKTSVKLATDPALAGVSGHYFANEREARPNPAALDEALQDRLWAVTEELVDRPG